MAVLSVCIPVYGVEKCIERCARSLFEQTMTDGIEFIFVNDCTTDKSIEILERILAEYPGRQAQTKIIHHEINKGLVAARNTGLAHATGDYIIHCDSDDWVDLELYESMYKQAVFSGADIVCAPFVIEGGADTIIRPKITVSIEAYIIANLGQHLNSLWTKMYRKEIAQDVSLNCPDHISMGEDLLRNIQMLDKCRKISFICDSYYHYWQNSASITHNLSKKHFLNLKELADILEEKYGDKYSCVCLHIKTTILLAALKNMHRNKDLQPLFNSTWTNTSFKNKFKMIFCGKCTLKGRFVLGAACISKSLTACILKHLYKSELG